MNHFNSNKKNLFYYIYLDHPSDIQTKKGFSYNLWRFLEKLKISAQKINSINQMRDFFGRRKNKNKK